jgi:hypothetical protein
MGAEFYLDVDGRGQDPANAIEILQSEYSATSLTGLWDGEAFWRLPGTTALLMMGTTSELQEALEAAYTAGLKYITSGSDMVIWYVRRKAGWEKKTVACIASLSQYWGLAQNDPNQVPGQWYPLLENHISSGVGLDTLPDVVERGRGVETWYPVQG